MAASPSCIPAPEEVEEYLAWLNEDLPEPPAQT